MNQNNEIIYKDEELTENAVCSKNEHTAEDGKK